MSRVILEAKTVTDVKKIAFDFASSLSAGVPLSSASTVVTVYRGVDASPSSVLSGGSSVSGTIATQMVTGGVLGVIYNLTCTGLTSDGQTVTLSGLLAITDTQT